MNAVNVISSVKPRYFFSPWVDFMALGGGSLVALLAIAIFLPKAAHLHFIGFTLVLANFINHPHFAHSYQMFYSNYVGKLRNVDYAKSLRLGYLFAGVLVPSLLAVFFAVTYFSGNYVVMGLAVNLMAFLVGWHYVKQGYGILMADSVLKSSFFSLKEKNILLVNAYACWFFTWAYANQVVREKQLFNLYYYTFEAPDYLIYVLLAVFVITSLMVAYMLCSRLIQGKGLPFNGVVAYCVALYMWLVFININPLFIFIVPAFHSLQYLVVVWRYRINYAKSKQIEKNTLVKLPLGRFFKSYVHYQMTIFVFTGMLLGYFAFFGLPYFLGDVIDYDRLIWDSSVFIVIFWVFINVHHYFIDSVIWRKNNKDVFQHLFAEH